MQHRDPPSRGLLKGPQNKAAIDSATQPETLTDTLTIGVNGTQKQSHKAQSKKCQFH